MLSTRGIRQADGAVTVEAAIALASDRHGGRAVCRWSPGGVDAGSVADAAREAARLVARGDRESAVTTARRIAPEDASISVEIVDGFAVAVVSAESALLPLVDISSGRRWQQWSREWRRGEPT